MKKTILNGFLIIGLTSLIFTGCRKKESETFDGDTSSASDNALAESYFTDVNNIADEGATGSLSSYKNGDNSGILSTCATITFATTATDTTITIDFGTVNCLCKDGRNRRGKILVNWSGGYKDPGHVHTITFDNYFVNDNQVLGTKTVTNNGLNNSGNLSYSISVTGTIILSQVNGGGTITWTSTRTREFIEGVTTPAWADDVYLISGTASGISSTGNSFTAQSIIPIRKELACYYIVSGSIEFSPSGKATRVIDFGNGTCDNDATVTINGKVYNIKLK